MGGVAKIVLHEMFNGAASVAVNIAHAPRDLDLHIEGKLIDGAACNAVKMTTHSPQEIFGSLKGLKFLERKYLKLDQCFGVFYAVNVFCDPEHRLQIAQATFALFDVRLNHISLAALFLVTLGALKQLGFDEFWCC